MVVADGEVSSPTPPQTILTCSHDQVGRAVFTGVDATNLEIFRDFLSLLPSDGDVVVAIADLDLRIPQASMLLTERAWVPAPAGRLIRVP